MDDDSALLRQFVSTRDEQAFAAIVRRYVDLVYSAARRQVRDDAAAQDVTPQVFVLLAEKARTIRDGEAVAGWLLVTTRFVALNSHRAEGRRRRHEREAAVMHQKRREESAAAAAVPPWERVGPMLDEAVARLKTEDRDALALRYFQGRSVADVAAALGVSPEAAQKRLSRAVDRLREIVARRGVTTSSEALSSMLMANALIVAPEALGSSVAGTALSAAAAGMSGGVAGGSTKGAVAIMAIAKTKVVAASVAAVMLVGVTGTIGYQQLRTPSGKSRQVRVEPATTPAVALPTQPSFDLADTTWKVHFDAVYRLKPDETFKRVQKPWIDERVRYYQATAGTAQVKSIPRGPDVYLFAQEKDGKLAWRQMSFGNDRNVRWALREVVGVSPQEVDLPQKILALTLPGDWVFRDYAPVEARMKGFADVLSKATGRPYEFALEPREREAIVVTGTFAFRPLPATTEEAGRTIYLTLSGTPPTKPSLSGAGGGTAEVFE